MAIMIAAGVAGGAKMGLDIAGSVLDYKASSRAASSNREQLRALMRLTKEQMVMTRKRGALTLGKHVGEVRQLVGEQKTSYAAGGVSIDTGSAATVREQTQEFGALDAMTIRENTEMEIKRLEQQHANLMAQHKASRRKQKHGRIKMALGIGSSVAAAVSNFAGQSYTYGGGTPNSLGYGNTSGDSWTSVNK